MRFRDNEDVSIAGYVFGALLGGDIQSIWPMPFFLASEAIFITGWLLVAISLGIAAYGAGQVLAGFATGLLLVIAFAGVRTRL